jgi:hypothetical protein
VHVESLDVSAMGSGAQVVLLVMVVIALRGYSALYFATRYDKRSPAVVALMGFVFLVEVLWGAVHYVSCVAEQAVTFDVVVRSPTVPAKDEQCCRHSGGRSITPATACATVRPGPEAY